MALDIRVRTRSHLNSLLRTFDEECLAQFNGQQLTKQQRAAARTALLALRNSVYNKIVKYVVVQDEIPKAQFPVERLDIELQQKVEDLETQSIQLQDELSQARVEGIESFEEGLRSFLTQLTHTDEIKEDLELPSCSQQRCSLPSDSDINRIKRILRESDHITRRIEKNVSSASNSLNDLTKVCQERFISGTSSQKLVEIENAFNENSNPDENLNFELGGATRQEEGTQPATKRQRYGPNFTKRFN